jgi:hypothetical protein
LKHASVLLQITQGDNDVYVQADFMGAVLKTSVIAGGGSSATWGQGEILEFWPTCSGIPTVRLTAYDEDVGSANDELGMAQLNLSLQDAESRWERKEWYPLKHNGKDAGAVHAVIEWDPDPPEPKRRGVLVKVLEARNLPSMDFTGVFTAEIWPHFNA